MSDNNKPDVRPDGYTEAERDELYNIIDKLPSEFFGGFGDWEALIVKAHEIVEQKRRRQRQPIPKPPAPRPQRFDGR